MKFFYFHSFSLKRSLPGYHSGSLNSFPVSQGTVQHSRRKVSTVLSSLVVLSPGTGFWVHLGCLCSFFLYSSVPRAILSLKSALMQPHPESYVQIWGLEWKDLDLLKQAKRRTTKMFPGLELLSCEDRLRKLG